MIAVIAFSRTGCKTALKAAQVLGAEVLYAPQRIAQPPFAPIEKPFREFYGELFQAHSALIFVGSGDCAPCPQQGHRPGGDFSG